MPTDTQPINPGDTALLIMEVQPSIVAMRDAADTARLLPRLQTLREAGLQFVLR